jgi:hypothetical protein
MSNFIRFKKAAVRTYVIAKVVELDNGVGAYDSQDEMIGFVRQTDAAKKTKIVDLLLDCLDPKKKFKAPDLQSLEEAE